MTIKGPKFVKVFRIYVKNDGSVSLWNHELSEALYDKQTGKFRAVDHENFFSSFGNGYTWGNTGNKTEVSATSGDNRKLVHTVREHLQKTYGATFPLMDIQVLKTASTRAHFVMHT